MSSYIADNLDMLTQQHYIRRASASDYWFDFTLGKLEAYQTTFGEWFCLILYASDTEDDSYVLPYWHVKHLFKEEYLDSRRRWVGSISNNLLRIRRSNQSMSISAYYNAFEYLEQDAKDVLSIIKEPEILYDVGEEVNLANLAQRIQMFNERYNNSEPYKRKRLSEYIARPNAITDYLKKVRNFTCQICGQRGFTQRNGSRYIEAHHIIELHNLVPGSLCSDNIVIVCANCHRKLHYAYIVYNPDSTDLISIEINGEHFTFERNNISQFI